MTTSSTGCQTEALTDSDPALAFPLAGLRVLEVGCEIALPYCSRLLRDLGADVVKVEPRGGDPSRRWPPPSGDPSAIFRYLNGGKSSVVLPRGQSGKDAMWRLVDSASVILLGGVEELQKETAWARAAVRRHDQSTRAVVTLSAFGDEGPYDGRPVSGLILQALAAWVSPRGMPDVHPVQVGGRAHEFACGAYAAAAALTALRSSRQTGKTTYAELSAMECIFNTVAYDMLRREALLEVGYGDTRYTAYIPGILRAADAWVAVNCLTGQHWNDMCALLEQPQYVDQYVDIRYAPERMTEFHTRIDPWFAARTADDVVELFQAFRIPATPLSDSASMLGNPQFSDRSFFVPDADGILMARCPIRAGQPTRQSERAPVLGQGT